MVTIPITRVRALITLLIATHEPPSKTKKGQVLSATYTFRAFGILKKKPLKPH